MPLRLKNYGLAAGLATICGFNANAQETAATYGEWLAQCCEQTTFSEYVANSLYVAITEDQKATRERLIKDDPTSQTQTIADIECKKIAEIGKALTAIELNSRRDADSLNASPTRDYNGFKAYLRWKLITPLVDKNDAPWSVEISPEKSVEENLMSAVQAVDNLYQGTYLFLTTPQKQADLKKNRLSDFAVAATEYTRPSSTHPFAEKDVIDESVKPKSAQKKKVLQRAKIYATAAKSMGKGKSQKRQATHSIEKQSSDKNKPKSNLVMILNKF